MPIPSRIAVSISVALSVSSVSLAFADDVVDTLPKVDVSATRQSESTEQTTRSVAVVTRAELDKQQPESVADSLKYESNVDVGGGSRAYAQTPVIRGLSGNRVLQVIDGVRQNTNSGHRGTYFLDPELIEQVEVVKGPSSALWGSGALGGLVAVQTRNARDLLQGDQTLGGYIRQGYHTADDKTLTSGALYGRQGDHDWLLNGYYNDNNDTRLGNGQALTNSAARQQGVMGKYGWQPDHTQRLSISMRHNEGNQTAPSNPSSIVSSSVPLVQQQTRDFNTTVDYRLRPDSNPWIDSRVTAYFNRTDYDEYRISKGQQDTVQYQTTGLNLSNKAVQDWGNLLGGTDLYYDKTWGEREGSNRPVQPNALSQVYGLWMQAELPFMQRWQLTPGVRYDYFRTEDRNTAGSARSHDHVSPSVALSWMASHWLTLGARYDEAFRAPTSEELYTSGTHFCMGPIACNTFVPNPDLRPETARNKELFAHLNFDNVLTKDRLTLKGNLFRNDVSNYIELQVVNDFANQVFESSYNNVSSARIQGYELAADYQIQRLTLSLAYGQSRGIDLTQGDALADIPADKLVFGVRQGLLNGDVELGSKVSNYRAQRRVPTSNSVSGYGGYTLMDVYATWQPQQGELKNWRVDLAVNNLTDRYYVPAFSELYAPGRNGKLSVSYRF